MVKKIITLLKYIGMVINTHNFNKIINDEEMKKNKGRFYDKDHYHTIITTDSDGWWTDSLGERHLLFKFRRGVIPPELQERAITNYKKMAQQKHPNRGAAGGVMDSGLTRKWIGKTSEAKGTKSNIAGFYDRPRREHKGKLGTRLACRLTAFTLNKSELWKNSIPFIKHCDDLYKGLCSKKWEVQKREWDSVPEELRIPETSFTTVTVNFNWRTACHLDTGDFCGGMGNLIVVGRGEWEGGMLGFPQFGVAIDTRAGDFLLMDVHQWHCNTEILGTDNRKNFRMSFVLYLREDMSKCSSGNTKTLNNIKYWLKSPE